MVDFLDGRSHGLLRDRAGGADEDEAHMVLAALVYNVLCSVYVHMPNLLGNQIADRNHGRAVDAVDGSALGNISEERFQRGDVRHIPLDDISLLGQVFGGFFAPKDESTHRLISADQIADDGAAQIAGRTGDDVKLICIVGSHSVFLHIVK